MPSLPLCGLLSLDSRRRCVLVLALGLSAGAVVVSLLLADGVEEQTHWWMKRAAYLVRGLREPLWHTRGPPFWPRSLFLLHSQGGTMTAAVTEIASLLLIFISIWPEQVLHLPQLLALLTHPSCSTAPAAPSSAAHTHLNPRVSCEAPPPSGETLFVLSTIL